MYRHIIKNTTMALGTLLVGSTLVFAASVPGTVTARDGKGMATVRTSDGKDHQVKLGDEFTVGTKVECEEKKNAMECRQVHAAVTPAPSAQHIHAGPCLQVRSAPPSAGCFPNNAPLPGLGKQTCDLKTTDRQE